MRYSFGDKCRIYWTDYLGIFVCVWISGVTSAFSELAWNTKDRKNTCDEG